MIWRDLIEGRPLIIELNTTLSMKPVKELSILPFSLKFLDHLGTHLSIWLMVNIGDLAASENFPYLQILVVCSACFPKEVWGSTELYILVERILVF